MEKEWVTEEKSYLEQREVTTKVTSNEISDLVTIKYEVSQGSVFSPLVLYILRNIKCK